MNLLSKKRAALCFLAALFLFSTAAVQAEVIMLDEPTEVIDSRQRVDAILTDKNGKIIEEDFYYEPTLAGVDIGPSNENIESVFFPEFNALFLKWSGNWVDENGYYWSDGKRYKVKHPRWGEHWEQYWNKDWHTYWERHWSEKHQNPKWHYRDKKSWHEHWHEHNDHESHKK